jgi:UDP-4-amino-4,6-dideoxy-N-acetyl-beta-L-altrosamine transaminase
MPMTDIPYGCQQIEPDDCEAVLAALNSPHLTQGPLVAEFEAGFAGFVGARFAVAVSNGTAALHLACLALGFGERSRVLVAGNSFAASANCVRYCGGSVEFVDLDPATLCLDLNALERKVNAAPAGTYHGIVAVDYAGYPCDLERLRAIAAPRGIRVIEDACHAPGAAYRAKNGQRVRSGSCVHADAAVFSFHPVKHLTTGEGGMVTTNDPELARKFRLLRTHGITKTPSEFVNPADGPWYMEMQELGFNYRIPDLLCALGLSQLRKLDRNLARRREIAAIYQRELSDLPLGLPELPEGVDHAYHLYVVRTPRRNDLYHFLKEKRIFCQVHYVPIYRHPYYERIQGRLALPENDRFYSEALSLPMFHGLTEGDQARVIREVRAFFGQAV